MRSRQSWMRAAAQARFELAQAKQAERREWWIEAARNAAAVAAIAAGWAIIFTWIGG